MPNTKVTTPSAARVASGMTSHAIPGSWIERLARPGLIARGVVYLLIGFLAIQIAVGSGAKEADQQGAFHYVASQPFGQFLLWILALGLLAYALWRLVQAITGDVDPSDPDQKNRERLIATVKFVIYSAFAFSAASIAESSGSTSSTAMTAEVMKTTGGQLLVGAVGAVIVVVGVVMAWQGWSVDFKRLLDFSKMSSRTQRAIIVLGRVGYIARGVVFALFGIFVIVAAVNFDPKKAEGLDVALSAIARAPAGPVLLVLVSLGLMAFGLYSLAESKYRRV